MTTPGWTWSSSGPGPARPAGRPGPARHLRGAGPGLPGGPRPGPGQPPRPGRSRPGRSRKPATPGEDPRSFMISGRLPIVLAPWPLTHSEAAAVASRTASGTGRPATSRWSAWRRSSHRPPVEWTRARTGAAVYSSTVPAQDQAPPAAPGHHAQAAVAGHRGRVRSRKGPRSRTPPPRPAPTRPRPGTPGKVLDLRAEAGPPPDQPLRGEQDETRPALLGHFLQRYFLGHGRDMENVAVRELAEILDHPSPAFQPLFTRIPDRHVTEHGGQLSGLQAKSDFPGVRLPVRPELGWISSSHDPGAKA